MDTATRTAQQNFPDLAWRWAVPLIALCGMAALFFSGTNAALFLFINGTTPHLPDDIWGNLTILGDGTVAILFILPFFHRRPDVVWQFMLAAILTALWVHLLKFPGNLRPPGVLALDSIHLVGPKLVNNSFPSGHTSTIFMLAGLFCMQRMAAAKKALILLLAMLVGLSRIACGVHWPMDVLGGAFGGWLAAAAGIGLARRWQAGLNRRAQQAFAIIILVLGAAATWYVNKGFPDTWLLQSAITAVSLALSAPGLWRLFKGESIKGE